MPPEQAQTTAVADSPALHTCLARTAALAWLNAFLAASTDEERPALYRTLSVEFFPAGLQIIGCDGTALFRTWVGEREQWPEIEEAPSRSVVVMDPDGFGVGYMRTLLRVTADEDHAAEELVISTAEADEEATLALGAEFMSERLTLRACGQRLDLRLYEGTYPNWRALRLGLEEIERVDGLTIATRLFGLVGKLKAASAVDLEFHGDTRHVAFTATGDVEIRGVLMPMRRPVKAAEPRQVEPEGSGWAADMAKAADATEAGAR